jgi:hypothetical protein
MLNKELCKRCINIQSVHPWDEEDEKMWHGGGWLRCPFMNWDISIFDDKRPDDCPYNLEYVVCHA